MYKKNIVTLTEREQKRLHTVLEDKSTPQRIIRRAKILLALDSSAPIQRKHLEIAELYQVSVTTVCLLSREYCEKGLEYAITYKRNPNSSLARQKITDEVEQQLIRLAKNSVPDGHKRWTIHLLAKKLVEMNLVDSISEEAVRRKLKEMELKLA